jgi:hypothetical protein
MCNHIVHQGHPQTHMDQQRPKTATKKNFSLRSFHKTHLLASQMTMNAKSQVSSRQWRIQAFILDSVLVHVSSQGRWWAKQLGRRSADSRCGYSYLFVNTCPIVRSEHIDSRQQWIVRFIGSAFCHGDPRWSVIEIRWLWWGWAAMRSRLCCCLVDIRLTVKYIAITICCLKLSDAPKYLSCGFRLRSDFGKRREHGVLWQNRFLVGQGRIFASVLSLVRLRSWNKIILPCNHTHCRWHTSHRDKNVSMLIWQQATVSRASPL